MDEILLEVPPRIAIYAPPNFQPWDDAVTLALTYAEIDFETIFDAEVLEAGDRVLADGRLFQTACFPPKVHGSSIDWHSRAVRAIAEDAGFIAKAISEQLA